MTCRLTLKSVSSDKPQVCWRIFMRSPQNNQSQTTLPLYTVAYCCEATKEHQKAAFVALQFQNDPSNISNIQKNSATVRFIYQKIYIANHYMQWWPVVPFVLNQTLRIPSMIPHDGFPIADLRYPSCWAINLHQPTQATVRELVIDRIAHNGCTQTKGAVRTGPQWLGSCSK